jgi:hypothetical protein
MTGGLEITLADEAFIFTRFLGIGGVIIPIRMEDNPIHAVFESIIRGPDNPAIFKVCFKRPCPNAGNSVFNNGPVF